MKMWNPEYLTMRSMLSTGFISHIGAVAENLRLGPRFGTQLGSRFGIPSWDLDLGP
jgi:hypothetical protein